MDSEKEPPASLRSLERVVRRVELGVQGNGNQRPPSPAGGMTGTAGWKDGTKLATNRKKNRADEANGNRRCLRRERGQTCLPNTEQRGRAPNEAKLSDGQGENKREGPKQPRPPCLFAGARG